MTDQNWISLFAAGLTFSGLIVAAVKYKKEKEREFQKRFYEEQLKYYAEAVDYAAKISTFEKNDKGFQNASDNFKVLYLGKMCIVEDDEVAEQMYQFHRVLFIYENLDFKKHHVEDELKEMLKDFAIDLAHSCRKSSIATWGMKNLSLKLSNFKKMTDGYEKRIIEFEKLISE